MREKIVAIALVLAGPFAGMGVIIMPSFDTTTAALTSPFTPAAADDTSPPGGGRPRITYDPAHDSTFLSADPEDAIFTTCNGGGCN